METQRTNQGPALLGGLCVALAATGLAQAQEAAPSRNTRQRVDALQQQLKAQAREIEALKQLTQEQAGRFRELAQRIETQEARSAPPASAPPAASAVAAGPAAGPNTPPHPIDNDGTRAVRVGVAPASEAGTPPPVAQIFDEPGILTPKGSYVLEPSLQYGYSSSNRVALVGYTVIPALLIGLIDVREVKRNTLTAALTGRWGISNRFEVEAKVPYLYRSDSVVSRELFTGSANERVFDSSGKAMGDVELAARYQLNEGQNGWPFMIGSLRYKTRTGKDPFEVVTDCVTRCVGNTTGTGLPLDLPTGSGFNSLQAGLTWLMPTDPAVFFGGFYHTQNFGRSNVNRLVLNGEREAIGSVKPGNVFGMNFGMGLALNEKSSFSVGIDLNTIGRTKVNGQPVLSSVRTQLSTLQLGYSYRIAPKTNLNVSVGAGLTRDTPDLTLTVRLPMSF